MIEFTEEMKRLDTIVKKCPICSCGKFDTVERYFYNMASFSKLSPETVTTLQEKVSITPSVSLFCKNCKFMMHFADYFDHDSEGVENEN